MCVCVKDQLLWRWSTSPGTSSGCEGTWNVLAGSVWQFVLANGECLCLVCPSGWSQRGSGAIRAWEASNLIRDLRHSPVLSGGITREGGKKEKDAPGMANSHSSAKKKICGESSGPCLPSCVSQDPPCPSTPPSCLFPTVLQFFYFIPLYLILHLAPGGSLSLYFVL